MANEFRIKNGFRSEGNSEITGSLIVTNGITGSFTGSFTGDGSGLTGISTYIDNLVTVGLSGSDTDYFSIKTAVDSIVDATANNTYTVRVSPGIYIEDTITIPSYVAVKGDSSISTVVSASNPSASIFIMSDQSMVIDMQIQGSTAPSASAIIYSSPTTPQTNAIAYVENVRFGTNYTNAKVIGTGSNGNCILQCSNVKYGGFTELNKSFDVGFHVTRTGSSGIGRMQLRNVTSTNGGVAGSDNNQIFALSDAPSCAFIVNGCLLTRAAGAATGTAFKVYNGGNLRLTGVNFQRWDKGIWAPQTGSGPSIDAIALNFENCTTDVLIEHTGSTGKVQGTDNFLKTQISLSSSLYEVGQDPRRITVGTKGADFTSISASVAYITDSSDSNRYIIEVGPGRYTEKEIDLTGKPYVSIVGSNIQTTQIFPSSSTQHIIRMGVNNEVSFLSLAGSGPGYAALYIDDVGDFAQAHKVSIYDCDIGIITQASTTDTQFYGEYIDINGSFTYGAYVSSSNGASVSCNLENYYLFPSASTGVGNYATGPSSSINLYACLFKGDSTTNSTAVKLDNGSTLEAFGLDIQDWDYGYVVPNVGTPPLFRVVGSMIHDSTTYDFDVQKVGTIGRYQGVSDHNKINNVSEEFYWNFLDDTDGENDVTRKLSVTFADGTHTDATTLIFEGSPMGVMSGGNITISSSFTITTAAGYGYLHNMGTEVFQRIDWADSNLTLAPNTNNYIFIDETQTLTSSPIQPPSAHNIILGRVVTNSTGIELIDNSPYFAAHMSNALSKFNRNALGPVFADGCIVSEDVTPFKLDVSAGLYYFGENEYDPTGGNAITFTRYYQSGSGVFGWNITASSTVPNNEYNSGSALVAMSSSYYTKHSLYTVGEGPDEEYFLVVGQNQYATLVEAEGAGLPTPPTYFSDGVVALASIYVQSGSANITQIQDIRPIIGFRAAGVNASAVHANLLGLNSDDHQQYLLVNGTRAMAGNLDMGGYNINNATSISSTFTGSLQGTSSWASNAVTASYVLNATSASYSSTASYVQTAQTASYVLNAISSSFATTASYVAAAGNNNEIQYNSEGSFAATASFAFIHASESLQQGFNVIASGEYSHAQGKETLASGNWAHAEGVNTKAVGRSSHVEGTSTTAYGDTSHAEGASTETGGDNGYLASITNGTASLSASYGDTSNVYVAGNLLYVNDLDYDQVLGIDTFLINSSSFDGTSTQIFLDDNSVTTTTAVILNASDLSTWLGDQTFGAPNSHTEGSLTMALGDASHAEGSSARAIGGTSHAEGRLSTAIGNASHAEGFNTQTTGVYSHAEGYGTVAAGFAQHASGHYNIPNTSSLAIIGNGIDDSNRSDLALFNTNGIVFNQPVTASIVSASFQGNLTGTASFAVSASWAPGGAGVTINNNTDNYLVTATGTANTLNGETNLTFNGSTLAVTGNVTANSFTGSLQGTATTASFVQTAQTASYVLNAISSSFSSTASFAPNFANTNLTVNGTREHNLNGFGLYLTQDTANYTRAFFQIEPVEILFGIGDTGSLKGTHTQYTRVNTLSGTTNYGIRDVIGSQDVRIFNLSESAFYVGTGTGNDAYRNFIIQDKSFSSTPSYFIVSGSTGRVGINKNIPTAQLDISGSTFITGSLNVTSGITGSLQGTATTASFVQTAQTASYVLNAVSASFASTASYVNGIIIKNNAVAGASFTGNPRKATVTFTSAFPNTNYSVTLTGEDSRTWTIESKLAGSFVISSNSNIALANNVFWQAISYGEFNG